MQTVNFTIQGDFYDSQIYSGILYLWNIDGDIIQIEWDNFIDELIADKLPEDLRFVADVALRDSSHLYKPKWQLLFSDIDFRELFNERMRKLHEIELSFTLEEIGKYTKIIANKFPFPHADSLIFYSDVFVAGRDGLLVAPNTLRQTPYKLWDGYVVNLSAKNRTLALAAGNDGVFEYVLPRDHDDLFTADKNRLRIQDSSPSNYVRWMYNNLFSSFYSDGSFFEFKKKDRKKPNQSNTDIDHHEIEDKFTASDLFSNTSLNNDPEITWGAHDKMCVASRKEISILKYTPSINNNFRYIGSIDIVSERPSNLHSDVIAADSAYFGYILEEDEGLLVISSDEAEHRWIPGEPTNWRVFPNTINYSNQLHVIYDDRLSIFSFNTDYFLNQSNKKIGLSKS